MFYCKPCQQANEWPETIFRSLGCCEVCDKPRVPCFERQASLLPPMRSQPSTEDAP